MILEGLKKILKTVKIQVKLLEIEINRLNGQVQKRLNKLSYIGTID